jgi:hypothetical protein
MPRKTKSSSFLQAYFKFEELEKQQEKKTIFDQLCQMAEKSQSSFPVRIKLIKRKDSITFDSDNFVLSVYVRESVTLRITANKPVDNLDVVNKVTSSLINFLNTILGSAAKNSRVSLAKTTKIENDNNFARRIVGIDRLAKINEIAQETLNPKSIMLEYEKQGHSFTIGYFFSEELKEVFISSLKDYEDNLPFDILEKEYKILSNAEVVAERLQEKEF